MLITDENATLNNIEKVKDFLNQSKINDQVILFVASHGLLDSKLDYYIATHNIDFSNPSQNGLVYTVLEDMLDNIPARQKLMLIDACNSGEVDKDELISDNISVASQSDGNVKARGFKSFSVKQSDNAVGLKNSFELMKGIFF